MRLISFTIPEYEFVLFFADNLREYLLHPVPYRVERSFEQNETMEKETRKEAIQNFQKKGYDLSVLAFLCAGHFEANMLGEALAEYWQPGVFQPGIAEILLSVQPEGRMALGYIEGCSRRDVSIMPAVIGHAMDREPMNADYIARLYLIEAKYREENDKPMILNAPVMMKEQFWGREHIFFPGSTTPWALDECKQHGTAASFLNLLYCGYQESEVTEEALFSYLDGVENMKPGRVNDSSGLILGELLEPLQKKFIESESDLKAVRLAQIEIAFCGIIDQNKMKCLRYLLQKSPHFYLDMAESLYCEDDQVDKKNSKSKNDQRVDLIYHVFTAVRFFPAERGGTVQADDLAQWVEDFKEGLMAINRGSRFGYLLGRVLANSPAGRDGYAPCEAVREIIERYADESLMLAYQTEIYNQRGAYVLTEGTAEQELAEAFQRNAEVLRMKYPQTAAIYDGLSETYKKEALREREEAEHVG